MRIIGFLILVILILALLSVNKERMNLKYKLITFLFCIIIIGSIMWYNIIDEKNSKNNQDIVRSFEQGEILHCGNHDVNNSRFNYEYGTASFVAKRGFEDISGVIVPIKNCY